jgi:hypothetical protein
VEFYKWAFLFPVEKDRIKKKGVPNGVCPFPSEELLLSHPRMESKQQQKHGPCAEPEGLRSAHGRAWGQPKGVAPCGHGLALGCHHP